MDSSSSESSTPKKHSRHNSSSRQLPRRSTRGPLDINDSPISPNVTSTPTNLTHQPSSLLSPTASQYATPRLPSPAPGSNLSAMTSPSFRTARSTLSPSRSTTSNQQKDFSYLLRPETYHPLTLLDVPPPFRTPSSQPAPSTPLSTLVITGHFRSAAIKAAQQLTAPGLNPADHKKIFDLVYTRLSCLTLCNQTTLASQEVKALEDLNASYYRNDLDGAHLVPWELRVLAVRLQGMGFNDARRGVMGYYDLAREARLTLTSLKKNRNLNPSEETDKDIAKWAARLEELGVRVASALIEMDDLEGATRFLATLKDDQSNGGELRFQKALLWLCLGDVEAARGCISSAPSTDGSTTTKEELDDENTQTILALAHIADSNFHLALPILNTLSASSSSPNHALYTQNLATTHLYLGNLPLARELLEELVEGGHAFHALTFNLSTIYELCTERSRSLKIGLAERVASLSFEDEDEKGGEGNADMGTQGGVDVASEKKKKRGWEKVNGDFKL